MSSQRSYTKLIRGRRPEIAEQPVGAQPDEPQVAGKQPRRGFASRSRFAVAIAVAAGIASSSAGMVVAGQSADATTHGMSTGSSAQALRVTEASASIGRRVRELEARGYLEVACRVDGDLMFNPHTNRYQMVRA